MQVYIQKVDCLEFEQCRDAATPQCSFCALNRQLKKASLWRPVKEAAGLSAVAMVQVTGNKEKILSK